MEWKCTRRSKPLYKCSLKHGQQAIAFLNTVIVISLLHINYWWFLVSSLWYNLGSQSSDQKYSHIIVLFIMVLFFVNCTYFLTFYLLKKIWKFWYHWTATLKWDIKFFYRTPPVAASLYYSQELFILRIITRKKHPQIKLQVLTKR